MGEHLATGPHELAVNVAIGAAGVVGACLATKAKELRAGGVVALGSDRVVTGEVENVLIGTHIRVVDVQRLLKHAQERLRIELAIFHVDDDVMMAGAVIGVDVNHLAAGVKSAAVKRHDRRAVRPKSVIATRGVERRVSELGTLIAPVERLTVNDTIVNNGLIGTNEAKIVHRAGTQRHVLERNGAGAVKGIVAVVLGAIVCRIGHERADVPSGLVRTQALKGEVLALGVTLGVHLVKGVVALAELDGVAALRIGGSVGKFIVGFTGAGIGNRAGDRAGGTVCKCRRCNAHRDERNGKQRCDRTRGRF